MKTQTLVGALAGAAALVLGGGLALARRQPAEDGPQPPYFSYAVQEGDTLTALALRFFGDAKKWPALFLDSPGDKRIDTLPIGSELHVPCIWVTVQAGDNLAIISQRALGDGTRWRRIYEANKKALPDPNKLAVGQRLAVPVENPQQQPTASARVSVGSVLDMLDSECVTR